MKRSTAIVWAALACGLTAAIAAPSALAATRCVGSKPRVLRQRAGGRGRRPGRDTIAIAPGTYAGGVKVGVSVAIVGAGAGSTIIKGGGPVLTLGVSGAAVEPDDLDRGSHDHGRGRDGRRQRHVWNGQPFGPDGAPTPSLLLDHTTAIGNALSASAGLTVQGGGLYTAGFPVSQAHSLIAHNTADHCFGC